MGFKCGIVGLPNVGKSTLFNALTESNKAEAANYPFATIEPNVGRVSVPDKRLWILGRLAKSEKIIPAYMDFVDIAGLVKGASSGEGLGNKFLSHIREVDVIVHVVRCFEDANISHVSSNINPIDDIETISTELKIADIETLENKKISLEKKSKQDKNYNKQISFIDKIINKISSNIKFTNKELEKEEVDFFKSLNLISSKPMLYVCNVDEKSIIEGNNLSNLVEEKSKEFDCQSVIISASIEAQIAELDDKSDKLELFKTLNLKETTLNKVIKAGYELLDLVNYYTSGPKETRSWTINKNTLAPQAAGKIHSDFEKGFIRAETISYQDYIKYNGEAGSRESGKMRQEGKNYLVKDGDIMHFLFNV